MAEAVIVEAVRSPVGKRNGGLSGVHPAELSAQVLNGLAERAGIDPGIVDDVIWGCVMQAGEQALDIGRTALLAAGWPESVARRDRRPRSAVRASSRSTSPLPAWWPGTTTPSSPAVSSRCRARRWARRWPTADIRIREAFRDRYKQTPNQGIGAEMIAEQWGFDRTAVDEFSLGSHEKAAAAQDSGAFDDQIVAIKDQDGNPVLKDEGIRRGTTIEKMATAQAGVQGGRRDPRRQLLADLRRLGRAAVHVGGEGEVVGAQATRQGAHRDAGRRRPGDHADRADPRHAEGAEASGLKLEDIGVFEVNEAFAPVPLAWLKDIGADEKKLNPNGGAIALGHPLGGSGARIMTTMLYHMRDKGIQYGLQTMCEGGGQANATIIELL